MKIIFGRSVRVGMLASVVCLLGHSPAAFASSILGTAQGFAVLGASTVTNTGSSVISGSVGSFPTAAVTGFPAGLVVNGTLHPAADAVVGQAQLDETSAYNALAALPLASDLSGQDLGGMTLSPGVFKFTTEAALTGALNLAFTGPNQRFVFQIGTTLTTASASSVSVSGGDATDGIFWLVGTSATLGSSTSFVGNILALTSITLNSTAKIECGRAFAQTGAVTLDSNIIANNCSQSIDGVTLPSDFGSEGFSPTSSLETATPEPGTFLLLGMSLVGLAVNFSNRKKK